MAIDPPGTERMVFSMDGAEPLILTPECFIYRGETIVDSGFAYMLFTEFMERAIREHHCEEVQAHDERRASRPDTGPS